MNNIVSVKTNFTSGQVSPSLYARGDLGVYANGARKLENVIIFPTGGVSRRAGLRFLAEISEPCRLVAFEFNTEQTYLLCFEPSLLKVFKEGQKIAELEAPGRRLSWQTSIGRRVPIRSWWFIPRWRRGR
ncbi:MAG: hypothetical protein ACLSFR_07610 [Alphaproteobacteria bacterium]